MNAISILSDKIMDEKVLLSEENSVSDNFAMVEKMLIFMKQIDEIYKSLNITTATMELEKLGTNTARDISNDNPAIQDLLEVLRKSLGA